MRVPLSILPVAALLAAGCAGSSETGPVAVHPVTGKVVYDGKPAAGVEVTLLPTDAPMVPRIPRNPHAVTGADGRFSITTYAEGDGAAEGGYMVVLSWPVKETKSETGSDEATDTDRLMGWYDGTHTKYSLRVKAESNELPVFDLPRVSQPPPVSQGVPGRN